MNRRSKPPIYRELHLSIVFSCFTNFSHNGGLLFAVLYAGAPCYGGGLKSCFYVSLLCYTSFLYFAKWTGNRVVS